MLTIDKYRIKSHYSEIDAATCKYFGYFEDIATISKQEISGNTATTYRNDFFGLLTYLGVHQSLHRFNLYINRFSSAQKYSGQRIIKICNDNKITQQLEKHFK